MLFLVFFNNFLDYLKLSEVIMFADDTVICIPEDDNKEIEKKLIKDLASIAHHFEISYLSINLQKHFSDTLDESFNTI